MNKELIQVFYLAAMTDGKLHDQEREMSDFKGSIQNGLGINSRTKESALNSIVTGEYEGYNLM